MAAKKIYTNGVERLSLYMSPEKMKRVQNYAAIWRKTLNATVQQCIDYTLSEPESDPLARKELLTIKKSELESQVAAIQSELADIEKIDSQKQMEIHNRQKSIEFAHMKLLEALKTNYNRIDCMPESVFKFYSDHCGESVDQLKEWLIQEIATRKHTTPTPEITPTEAPEQEKNTIEFSRMRLLESFKTSYNRIDLMPESVFKFYSDQCGESVDQLKEWLRNKTKIRGLA